MNDRMNDYEAIRRLLALYGQLLDSKRIAEWGQLFTEEAIFRVWGKTYRGRAEIEREIGGMQPDRPGKHVVLQPVIDIALDGDPDSALAWTDLCALATSAEGEIATATIGRYQDRLARDAESGRWRILERVLVMGGEDVPEDVAPSPPF